MSAILNRILAKIGIDSHFSYYLLNRYKFPNYNKSLEILKNKNPFLITSTGRTGTALFAKILNSNPDYLVVHEPVPKEQYYHCQAIMDKRKAEAYIKNIRLREMAFRVKKHNVSRYGEVNGALRQHVLYIKKYASFFTIGHIIRNAKDYVNSVMNRSSLTKKDKIYSALVPPESEISPDKWKHLTKFEKTCWLWAYENKLLLNLCDFTVKFENLISDYNYFRINLLKPLDLDISYEIWEKNVKIPVNATKIKKFTHADWTNEQKEAFKFYCRNLMEKFGYE